MGVTEGQGVVDGENDGLNEETYGKIAFVFPLMKPVVVAVDARHSVAAVERHEHLHHVITQLIEVINIAVEIRRALVGHVTVVVDDNGVADAFRRDGRPWHRRPVLRPIARGSTRRVERVIHGGIEGDEGGGDGPGEGSHVVAPRVVADVANACGRVGVGGWGSGGGRWGTVTTEHAKRVEGSGKHIIAHFNSNATITTKPAKTNPEPTQNHFNPPPPSLLIPTQIHFDFCGGKGWRANTLTAAGTRETAHCVVRHRVDDIRGGA